MAETKMKVVGNEENLSKLDEAIKEEAEKAVEKEPEMTDAQKKKLVHERAREYKAYTEKVKKQLIEEAEMFEIETRRMKAELEHFEVRQDFLRFSEERKKEAEEEQKKAEKEEKKSKIIQPTPEQVSKLGKSKK
jgi:hypothetical protein